MSILILSNILLVSTLSLLLANNPLLMGLTILMMALLISMLFASIISSWYAFLIFLIYVGGMLVMFAYFVSIIPNQSLKTPINLILISTATVMLTISSYLSNLSNMNFLFFNNQLNEMFMKNNSLMLILLALLLLFTMIIVVKITCSSKGPMRAFMSYV